MLKEIPELRDEFRTTMNQLPPITLELKDKERMQNAFKHSNSNLEENKEPRWYMPPNIGWNPSANEVPNSFLPSKVRLDQMVSLAMIKGNSRSGPIKKMFHVPSMTVYCVKEVPINSRETRNGLKRIIGGWETAVNGETNPHLTSILGTHWNSPEGCVSIVIEHMNGGSLQNLLESVGSIPEDLL